MTSGPAIADLQRLSEEVARDPGSSSFLPLAEAYRRMGKTQAALRVCLRGLERSPGHVGGICCSRACTWSWGTGSARRTSGRWSCG